MQIVPGEKWVRNDQAGAVGAVDILVAKVGVLVEDGVDEAARHEWERVSVRSPLNRSI